MVGVSRETDRPDAALVEEWFGAGAPLAFAYADMLAVVGVRRGLIGPREASRIWHRHLLNCVVVHPLVGQGASVGDVGSGAGLPGVVLALARPDLTVTLIEPLLRRSAFLHEVVQTLAVSNLRVVRARAEELHGQAVFEVVTARAVAPLERLAGWALPLCRPGGELIALKGFGARDELATAGPTLARLHAGPAAIERCGAGVVDPATTVVRIQSGASSTK